MIYVRLVCLGAVLGLLVGMVALLSPSGAFAAGKHPLVGTFGSAAQPTFVRPEALTVDQATGDLLVVDVEANTISRFHADGTPADFAALGTNVIDGVSGADKTPQEALSFGFGNPKEVQVAVDDSGGSTDGDIYVTQPRNSHNLIDIFAHDGTFLGQLTEFNEGPAAEGSPAAFGITAGVTVDSSGAVYVSDVNNSLIHKYVPSANPAKNSDSAANFPRLSAGTLAPGAGPTAGFLFADTFGGELGKLDSATGVEQFLVSSGNTTVAVDPATGHVYAAAESHVAELDASESSEAQPLSSIAVPSEVTGVAVDQGTGNVYVARTGSAQIEVWGPAEAVLEAATGAATPISTETATLRGSVNPAGTPLTDCHFEYDTSKYKQGEAPHGTNVPCETPDAGEIGTGSVPVAVHANVSALNPGAEYHYRLATANPSTSADGEDKNFQTLGPSAATGSVSQITAISATLSGQVNPNGQTTGFYFEYDTSEYKPGEAPHGTRIPLLAREAGSGNEPAGFSQPVNGLAPDTVYHYRMVATNATATSHGTDGWFATFPGETGVLPDGRAYELVSPPQKAGEVIPPEPSLETLGGSCRDCLPGESATVMPMRSAPDGEALLYEGEPFAGGLASGPNEYLANRTASGWGTQSLSEPFFEALGPGFQGFSADLSSGVLYQAEPALSPDAPTRQGEAFANLYLRGRDGSLGPLVTGEPPDREPGSPTQHEGQFRVIYAGANSGTSTVAAFSHVLFEANDALTATSATAPAAEDLGVSEDEFGRPIRLDLYESFAGRLRLVNVLPGNASVAAGAVLGSGRLRAAVSNQEGPDVDHAVSADGSRIFWSDEASGQLYVRIDGSETRKIKDLGLFVAASSDGSKVLLSDGCLYDLAGEACEADLSSGHGEKFQGILGAAEDLSRVYFVDTAVLTGAQENANHEHAEDGQFNLYAWDRGESRFLGTLSERDDRYGEYGDWRASRSSRTAQVSADGSYLAFMSDARLTGYDNDIRGGGECVRNALTPSCSEVFEYAAGSRSLSCASCNPTGQRPLGRSNLSVIKGRTAFPPLPQPGNLSANGGGRLFFESQDALSLSDTNAGVTDVYEWEPAGVGSCERAGGCVFLISSGDGANDSMFLDSSANGDDAFFITRDRLVKGDENDQLDVYDARAPHIPGERVGSFGGETPPCGGEACAGPLPSAPAPGPPGSSIFTGAGNFALTFTPPPTGPKPLTRAQRLAKALRACARKPRRQRPPCRAQAIRRYGPLKAKAKSRKAGR